MIHWYQIAPVHRGMVISIYQVCLRRTSSIPLSTISSSSFGIAGFATGMMGCILYIRLTVDMGEGVLIDTDRRRGKVLYQRMYFFVDVAI